MLKRIPLGVRASNDTNAKLPNLPLTSETQCPASIPHGLHTGLVYKVVRAASIRAGPGSDTEKLGTMKAGDLLKVIESRCAAGGSKVSHVRSVRGWV